MTRRSLFGTLAAALAGRKLLPATPAHVHSAHCNHVSANSDLSIEPLLAAVRHIKTYTPATYAVGFTVNRAKLDSERDLYAGLVAAARRERRTREEELIRRTVRGLRKFS
jgi:hypothetical protein